jgi:hypothetical protein
MIVRASENAKGAARARGITEISKASGNARVEAFITYFGINTTSRSLPGIDHRHAISRCHSSGHPVGHRDAFTSTRIDRPRARRVTEQEDWAAGPVARHRG